MRPQCWRPSIRHWHRGHLLLALFEGARVEEFSQPVAPAFYWPQRKMVVIVHGAGFAITYSVQRRNLGHRPHAALVANRD